MIRLIGAELLRLRSRRLTWVALGAVLLVVVLTQIAVFTSVKPLTADERADAQSQFQQAQRDYAEHRDDYEQQAQECVDQGGTVQDCTYTPRLEDYAQRTVASFPEAADLALTIGVFVAGLALMLLAASFIGAEFSSGSLANWLSFVPERPKVYGSKLIALLGAAALATAAVGLVTVALTIASSDLAGADITGVGAAAATGGRGVLVGVVAVVVGFSLAVLTRHTIAAAGTVLGYLLLSFVVNVMTGALPGLQALQRVLPENNALALLNAGHTYTTYVNQKTADGGYTQTSVDHVITMTQASLYWSAAVVVLLGVAFAVFHRRDVN